MAMLKALCACEEYLAQEFALLDGHVDKSESVQNAIEMFHTELLSLPRSMAESSETLKHLSKANPVFSNDDRVKLSGYVSTHVKGKLATGSVVEKASKAISQSCPYLYEYLSKTIWDTISDERIPFDECLGVLAGFAVKILGIRHPDAVTSKTAVGIVASARRMHISPDEAYAKNCKFKSKVEAKRDLFPGAITFIAFDRDPSVYMRAYPRAYAECDPPVSSRVNEDSLRELVRKENMPCRGNNQALRINSKTKPRQSADSSPSSVAAGSTSSDSLIAQALAAHFLGKGPDPFSRGAAPPQTPPATLSIADGPAPPAPTPAAGLATPTLVPPASAGGVGGLDAIINVAKAVAAAKGKKGKKGGDKKGKKKVPSAPSSADSEAPL